MTQIQTVGAAFAREVAGMASLLSLRVPLECVRQTFTVDDAARCTATQCFRLEMTPDEVAEVSILQGMRRDYQALAEDGTPVRVTCHLSGGIHNGQALNWHGQPIDALG